MSYLGKWRLDKDSSRLLKGNESIVLKPLEWRLLHHFVQYPDQTFTNEQLKSLVWQQQYLSDSAVKKAISSLRKALKEKIDRDVIITHGKQGYQLAQYWQHTNFDSGKVRLGIGVVLLLIATLFTVYLFQRPMNKNIDSQARSSNIAENAYSLYLKGKVAYYEQGDIALAIQLFEQSLTLEQHANPASAALLDIYGLSVRSLTKDQRTGKVSERLLAQVARVNEFGQQLDNAVALSKYALVNLGDQVKAKAYLERAKGDLFAAHDLHIPAYVYALEQDKSTSLKMINFAEQRMPGSGVVAWYKGLILLVLNDASGLKEQVKWAQKVSKDWYPLVYIAPMLKEQKHQQALTYLSSLTFGRLPQIARHHSTLDAFLAQAETLLSTKDVEPFEAEILYFLAVAASDDNKQQQFASYISTTYPEKRMLLPYLYNWLTDTSL